jgi:hypothetical protein
MAQPITGFKIVEIGKPRLGELKPHSVRADVKIHLNVRSVLATESFMIAQSIPLTRSFFLLEECV